MEVYDIDNEYYEVWKLCDAVKIPLLEVEKVGGGYRIGKLDYPCAEPNDRVCFRPGKVIVGQADSFEAEATPVTLRDLAERQETDRAALQALANNTAERLAKLESRMAHGN